MEAEDNFFNNSETKKEIKTEPDPECVMPIISSLLKIEKEDEYFNHKGIYWGNFLVKDLLLYPKYSKENNLNRGPQRSAP